MYWKGKVAFYSVPNQIFNHATSQSALINTLMPSSLHCPLGRESSKDTIAMGMCDSYTLNPPLCMDYILPVSLPRCIQSILLRCCVWKLYGEGSLMLSYEGFNHIHYCPSELPLAKGMLEGGQFSSPDPTMQTCTSSLTDQPLTSGSGYHTGDIRTPSIPQPYQPYNASQLDSRMDDEELLKHPTKGLFLN